LSRLLLYISFWVVGHIRALSAHLAFTHPVGNCFQHVYQQSDD
jgi:hypothetical protein